MNLPQFVTMNTDEAVYWSALEDRKSQVDYTL